MHNLKTLLDYRWMVEEGWPLTVIEDYELYIKHVHIDNPLSPFPTRIVPRLNDGFDYAPFINTLKNIAYKEIISIEASVFKDFAKEIREGLGVFKANHIEPYRSLS
jgi:sugar phosphate isomerase/epimerase